MDNKTDKLKELLSFTNSLLISMEQSIKSTPESNVWKHSSYKIYVRKYNQLIDELSKINESTTLLDYYDLAKIPSSSNTVASQQKNYFDSVHSNLQMLKAFLEGKVGFTEDKILQIKDFLVSNLRRATFKSPDREIEVQDTIEQLFIGKGMMKGVDYDREVGRIKISIKEVIPDFILPKLGLAVEVKLSKSKTKSKTIVDEINADIMSYSKQYSSILFLIYDIGSIRDELEFKDDLEINDGVSVIIIKH